MYQEVTGDDILKKTSTAHASAAGVALVTYDYLNGTTAVELVSVCNEKTQPAAMSPKSFFHALNEARLDEVDEVYDDRSHYQQLRDLNSFRAFGEASNFNELAAERIGYGVGSEDVPFLDEIIEFKEGDPKDIRRALFPGELRGFKEIVNETASSEDVLEPVSVEEALTFICSLIPSTATVEEVNNPISIALWLKPELARVSIMLEDYLSVMRDNKEDTDVILQHLNISKVMWKRVKISVARDNVGEDWTCCNRWSIGQREGTIEDESRQNDLNFTKLDQYHEPGERVDGRLLFSEELALAEEKNDLITNSMYYKGGEITNKDKVAKGEPPIFAKPGENRGWSERSVYFLRCASSRDEVFADKLWHILTWPLADVEEGMKKLRADYKASVRSNSEGPLSEKVNGRWRPAPLRGDEALKHLRRVGVGSLKGQPVFPDVSFTEGSTWHKLFLSKKHMDGLESALMWRRGIIRLDVGGTMIEEKFEQTFEGLPREYVMKTYGRKA